MKTNRITAHLSFLVVLGSVACGPTQQQLNATDALTTAEEKLTTASSCADPNNPVVLAGTTLKGTSDYQTVAAASEFTTAQNSGQSAQSVCASSTTHACKQAERAFRHDVQALRKSDAWQTFRRSTSFLNYQRSFKKGKDVGCTPDANIVASVVLL